MKWEYHEEELVMAIVAIYNRRGGDVSAVGVAEGSVFSRLGGAQH
jgi:hypothetical protein